MTRRLALCWEPMWVWVLLLVVCVTGCAPGAIRSCQSTVTGPDAHSGTEAAVDVAVAAALTAACLQLHRHQETR